MRMKGCARHCVALCAAVAHIGIRRAVVGGGGGRRRVFVFDKPSCSRGKKACDDASADAERLREKGVHAGEGSSLRQRSSVIARLLPLQTQRSLVTKEQN
jgi:hypothetical protein